jgi:putative acetyltransferase
VRLTTCQLWGYFNDDVLAGIIAFREGMDRSIVRAAVLTGPGRGHRTPEVAQGLHDELSLRTFQRNAAARRFYERHGFVLIKETDGLGNEEKEPDAMETLAGWGIGGSR